MPNAILMEQKKFVKFGLTTENFKKYVGIITGEVEDYMSTHVFANDVRRGPSSVPLADARARPRSRPRSTPLPPRPKSPSALRPPRSRARRSVRRSTSPLPISTTTSTEASPRSCVA